LIAEKERLKAVASHAKFSAAIVASSQKIIFELQNLPKGNNTSF
jgi:hypothetical protein